ncbi:MAG: hypothetical protein CVU55_15275 [Deltaproteobacteria bacterium HGW-Deltaproteobacteria-13]|jgi:predicted small secreted protein|nr:MAG: hypothetical protein CVU55_15275 [Deltaproteobacteria bacterium HGW-Deltaproteobacteria-13]
MKKTISIIASVLVIAFVLGATAVQSQTGRSGYGYGYGMGHGYGYGYGMGPGMMGGYGGNGMMGGDWLEVPTKLPAPKNAEWVQKLREILTLEKESLAQYETDQEKFNAYMPYMMVIPQEENHVEWIGQLFTAYGLTADGKVPPVVDNKSLTDAYELSVKLENELLPRYEWLIKKAEDRDTAEVLNLILIQSRWHLVMFDHALRMGHGYGYGRGWGMGPGMMGGYYGSETGRGYGRHYQSTGKAINAKEAETMMKDYLKSSRNPNLKLGKVKDAGDKFEAEILTKKNDLVDKVYIDKRTGQIWSAY